MVARYGLWFAVGLMLGLLHSWMIVRSVRHINAGQRSAALWRTVWNAVLRVLTSAGAMGLALIDEGWAAVAVAIGLVFGRWGFAITFALCKHGMQDR